MYQRDILVASEGATQLAPQAKQMDLKAARRQEAPRSGEIERNVLLARHSPGNKYLSSR